MRILFDQGTPAPLRHGLREHEVSTCFEMGWDQISNGELLAAAEVEFDILITTDQNLEYQQNLKGRRLAILVLPTTSWPRTRKQIPAISAAVASMLPGGFQQLVFVE